MTITDQEILRRVQDAIREQLGFGPEAPVPPEADFFGQLGGDSIDLAELQMNLEEQFDTNLPDAAVPPPVTPAQIAGLLRQCLVNSTGRVANPLP